MKALIIIIMGGVGDIRGAIVAALILGLVETTVARLIDPASHLPRPMPSLFLFFCSGRRVCSGGSRHEPRVDFKSLVWGAVLLLVAACVPLVANGYWMSVRWRSRCLPCWRQAGRCSRSDHYISLATAAFRCGGYLVGTGMSDYNGFWTMVVIAPVVGAVLAFLIGIATLRLSGVYFVIFTLGLAR